MHHRHEHYWHHQAQATPRCEETATEYRYSINLPPLYKESVDLRVVQTLDLNVLERSCEPGRHSHYSQHLSLSLPENSDPTKISAELKEGVLEITIKKSVNQEKGKIHVR